MQEKSKQLKVVELELARYKNKPAGAATSTTPAFKPGAAKPAASSIAASLGADDEPPTGVNPIPEAAKPAPARPAPAARPAAPAAKLPAISAAAPKKTVEREERTMVMPANTPPSDEDDFTSLIDNLGES